MKRLEVVVGGQYGSEAKGHVTTRLLDKRHDQMVRFGNGVRPLTNIRIAGPNAGHTGYDADGRAWALRSVPVGATRTQATHLYIAPGSEIDPEVLISEVIQLRDAGLMKNKLLIVSPDATLIEDRHKGSERAEGLVEKIGSTGKGIGAARADRLMRTAKRLKDDRVLCEKLATLDVLVGTWGPQQDDEVVIEGTQGYGLGLHGKHYPQCTSSDCRAIDFVAMAGLNPWNANRVQVWVTARMFPIRVAGNSGPMYAETSWQALGLPEERTTVTKKVRRVGLWDDQLIMDAVHANGGYPTVRLAITMLDQAWPELAGLNSWESVMTVAKDPHGPGGVGTFVNRVSNLTKTTVGMLTTGPRSGMMI